jgi:hypothetical protein
MSLVPAIRNWEYVCPENSKPSWAKLLDLGMVCGWTILTAL